jgi:microcystin-dependent protein
MSQPFVGEIRVFGGNFAPSGWALCNGQILPISQNEVLFTLIGTTYGGDGQTTFALPDLQGRSLIHQGTASSGTTYVQGGKAGAESVTIMLGQFPLHGHNLLGTNVEGTSAAPGPTTTLAMTPTGEDIYGTGTTGKVSLAGGAVGPAPGQSLPHDNRQPYLAVTYIISLFGIFPSRN